MQMYYCENVDNCQAPMPWTVTVFYMQQFYPLHRTLYNSSKDKMTRSRSGISAIELRTEYNHLRSGHLTKKFGRNSGQSMIWALSHKNWINFFPRLIFAEFEYNNLFLSITYVCFWLVAKVFSMTSLRSAMMFFPLCECCSNLVFTADLDMHDWRKR